MSENKFFRPTQLNKEYFIFELIEGNCNITQRQISTSIGISVSMVNQYLDNYVSKGYIKKNFHSSKKIDYVLTDKGTLRKKVLNLAYLDASFKIYKSAQNNIQDFMKNLVDRGFNRIVLYGAGEVAEVFLQNIAFNNKNGIAIIAVLDDDIAKQGTLIGNNIVLSTREITNLNYDGILISSYKFNTVLFEKLIKMGIDEKTIIRFF